MRLENNNYIYKVQKKRPIAVVSKKIICMYLQYTNTNSFPNQVTQLDLHSLGIRNKTHLRSLLFSSRFVFLYLIMSSVDYSILFSIILRISLLANKEMVI